MKKADSFKFFVANGDLDHARKFFTLGSSQIRAVDNLVFVTATVELILLPQTVGNHLSFVILLVGTLKDGYLCNIPLPQVP